MTGPRHRPPHLRPVPGGRCSAPVPGELHYVCGTCAAMICEGCRVGHVRDGRCEACGRVPDVFEVFPPW